MFGPQVISDDGAFFLGVGDIRFREFYDALDRGSMDDKVRELADDEIVSALAACSTRENALRANVLATELHNRLHERTRLETGLLHLEERYRLIVEESPDPLLLLDVEDNIIHASAAAAELFGVEPDELSSRRARELIHDEDRERFRVTRAMLVESPGEVSLCVRSAKRPDTQLDVHMRTFRLGPGPPVGVVATIREAAPRDRIS